MEKIEDPIKKVSEKEFSLRKTKSLSALLFNQIVILNRGQFNQKIFSLTDFRLKGAFYRLAKEFFLKQGKPSRRLLADQITAQSI